MKIYIFLLSLIITSCSINESSQEDNNGICWDSIKIPICTHDDALVPIFDQVINDESTCEYFEDRDFLFVINTMKENDTSIINIELIEKNSINKIRNAGCFVYNDKLFIIEILNRNVELFKSSGDSILLYINKNKNLQHYLFNDRGSFWTYKLCKDSLKLVYKSICNY